MCQELDANTLVKILDEHRLHGWTAFDIVRFMCRASHQLAPKTVAGYATFIIEGSPMLRGLVYKVLMHVSDRKRGKLLITEENPLLA